MKKKSAKLLAAVCVMLLLGFNTYMLIDIKREQNKIRDVLCIKLKEQRNEEPVAGSQRDKIAEQIERSEEKLIEKMNGIEKMIAVGSNIQIIEKKPTAKKNKETNLLYEVGAFDAKEEEAYRLMKEGRYGAASKLYKEIIRNDPERIRARYYGMYSLFYANEMNKENYEYILQEIAYLRGKGLEEASFKKIEERIKRERAIEDEQR